MESTVEHDLRLVTGGLKEYQNPSKLRELTEKEIKEEKITAELKKNESTSSNSVGGITL